MRTFNYSALKDRKWDNEIIGYIAGIHEHKAKQELFLKQKPDELDRLVEIAKVQSTEASNAIEGIRTTSTRLKQLLTDKTTGEPYYLYKVSVDGIGDIVFAKEAETGKLKIV